MDEKAKYEKMYQIDEYRVASPGAGMAPHFLDRYLEQPTTVNVYGCGPGRCGLKFYQAGHRVNLVDIAENALDDSVRSHLNPPELSFFCENLRYMSQTPAADFGYCVDVMEHLPRDWVIPSLERIRIKSEKLVMFIISGHPDSFGDMIGETLHMTVESAAWWEARLEMFWPRVKLVDGRNQTHFFIVEA